MAATKILATCLLLAAQTYDISPAVLLGIYKAEGGKAGQEVSNTNDTHDLGPMQINTLWIPVLAEKWGVSEDAAKQWVRDDVCTNTGVAAWILKGHIEETGSVAQAIAHYHSRTPHIGGRYQEKVVSILRDRGLLE